MIDAYLRGVASAVGSRVEENTGESLGHPHDECERIARKTGIRSRPVVAADEYTSDLAIRATRALIASEGLTTADVGILIVCTQTPDHLIPGVSSRVHGELGFASDCLAVDVNQGCSGFVYGSHIVSALLRSGTKGDAILVNADSYSRLVRPSDLTTRVIFGDAAAATRFSTRPGGLRLIYSRCFSDGSGYGQFVAHNSALLEDASKPAGIAMDGPAILGFALRVVPEAINEALREASLTLADIRMVAFHQANSFIVEKLARKLGLREDQVAQNCLHLGNTVSASIPLLLLERMDSLRAGDLVMAVGFGVGLSWGVAIFERVTD